MKIISVINLKGGVGKTTTSLNIGHILATLHDKRVLLIDNDKQGNLSKVFGAGSYDDFTITDILTGRHNVIDEVIMPTQYKNLDIIGANMHLLGAYNYIASESCLKIALEQIAHQYDYCIIDNAPDINISTINALVASHEVIIPIKIDKFALDGLKEVVEQINAVRDNLNFDLTLLGCLVTAFMRNDVCTQGLEWLRQESGYPIFATCIRRTHKVDESTFTNVPLFEYSPRCGASVDYKAFVWEYFCVSEMDTQERGERNGQG